MENFFYKLFPYKSIYEIDENSITIFFIIIIIFIFLFQLLKLAYVTRRLKRRLGVLVRDFEIEKIEKDKLLNQVWNDYENSFVELQDKERTDEPAYEYFNEKNLLSANTNLNLINSIPSILVGFGILGTFVGLTYGISSFQTESTQAIKNSIQILLSGMGTAFVSSLWGMGLSLVFTFLEKIQVNSLRNSIHQLCYILDRKYKMSIEDESFLQIIGQEKLFAKYLVSKNENGDIITLGNILRDIYRESKKQSVALRSFSTDLANIIEAGFERILNDPENSNILKALQSLNNEIVNLGEKLQDPATEMIQTMINDLKASLEKMVVEFNNTVSDSAKEEIEALSTTMGNAGQALNDFPGRLEEMTANLNENFQNLQVAQELLLTKQAENISASQGLLSSFNSSIEDLTHSNSKIKEILISMRQIHDSFNSVIDQIGGISNNLLSSAKSFQEGQEMFSQQSNEFLENNSATIYQIQESLNQAKDLQIEYSDKFEIIQNGLQGIFNQIDEGLIGYRETVGESMEQFLGRYTEALTSSAQSLAGAAEIQRDILEDLTEQLDNLQNGGIH